MVKKLALFLPLLLLFACNKHDQNNNSSATACHLNRMTSSQGIARYIWDGDRVSEVSTYNESNIDKFDYSYDDKGRLISVKEYHNDTPASETDYSFPNDTTMTAANNKTKEIYYFANGHVSRMYSDTGSAPILKQRFYWLGNNLVKVENYSKSAKPDSYVTYQYDQHPAPMADPGVLQSRNNLVKASYYLGNGSLTSDETISYEYNMEGYPKSNTDGAAFEYDCK